MLWICKVIGAFRMLIKLFCKVFKLLCVLWSFIIPIKKGISNSIYLPDPQSVIKIMREALESEYVSNHLHLWIDLIFGCKQNGEEAEKSDNCKYITWLSFFSIFTLYWLYYIVHFLKFITQCQTTNFTTALHHLVDQGVLVMN